MKLLNINLNLDKTFTPDDINRIKPDAIILASGAISKVPNIQGMNDFEVITALEVLKGRVPEWENIAVIGGGMIGLETAEFLADKGKRVTVFEMYKLAADVGSTSRWGLISRLRRKLKLMSSTKVIKITQKGIIVLGRDGEQKEIETDAVVIAAGLESLKDLENAMKNTEIEYYLAGSCKEPGQITQAIEDGFEIGCAI